jgi:hypothetical protein
MADDVPPVAAQSMTRDELQAEAELQMHEIGQRFRTLPPDKDELLRLLEVSAPIEPLSFLPHDHLCSYCIHRPGHRFRVDCHRHRVWVAICGVGYEVIYSLLLFRSKVWICVFL